MPNSETLSVDRALQQAVASHRAGEVAAAVQAYQAVLGAEPGHPEANHNLGVLMVQSGRIDEGLARLRRALDARAGVALYVKSYARGLVAAGRRAEAQSDTEGAIGLFREALAMAPDLADAHYHLGSALSEHGRIAEGFAHYMRRAALVYGTGEAPPTRETDPPHRVKHDLAQRDYLACGKAAADAPAAPDMFVLADGARLDGPAVNSVNASDRLLAEWRGASPQMVVIDDFLTAPALEKLRAYCAGSTIWRKNYAAGYLGAAPEDGFACPLLAQIVEEIQSVFRPIVQDERFRYLGAFKYDSELSAGTNTHADNSALNVNFYITPDEANLDPYHGGMEIWDLAAPDIEAQRRYSSSETAVRDLLRTTGARSTIGPHRANRAVIFRSALFHRTDTFKFRPDYLSRRINISLLFGEFR